MKISAPLFALLLPICGTLSAQQSGATANPALLQVHRIYVADLKGGPQADALRDLIIDGIDGTKLFVLTDNPDRADATLKGAADDHTFTDTFDSEESINTRQNTGVTKSSSYASRQSLSGGISAADNESHHIKERQHEAYAAVRLCNRDGDVIWSTTQESLGAKFRGASADVAAKVARQLTLDVERAREAAASASGRPQPAMGSH